MKVFSPPTRLVFFTVMRSQTIDAVDVPVAGCTKSRAQAGRALDLHRRGKVAQAGRLQACIVDVAGELLAIVTYQREGML